MKVDHGVYGTYHGQKCSLIKVSDENSAFFVTLSDFGATILRVVVPDKDGNPTDISLTDDTSPEALAATQAYFGASVGRVANRIAEGKFTLNEQQYELYINNEPNTLHGGEIGFDRKIWTLVENKLVQSGAVLVFQYKSVDGEENFPGTLITTLTYTILPFKISWEFSAVLESASTVQTIVNLTNHGYWNLDGVGGDVNNQIIELKSSVYNRIDKDGLTIAPSEPVPPNLDMKVARPFGDVFTKFGDVDNNFQLDEAAAWKKNQRETNYFVAQTYSSKTGIEMTIHTTDPGVQLYTGNSLGSGTALNITVNGVNYPLQKHYAFCLETQRVPNAINNPDATIRDSVILSPGEEYYHRTVHEFKIRSSYA